jgi:hypothetical protein
MASLLSGCSRSVGACQQVPTQGSLDAGFCSVAEHQLNMQPLVLKLNASQTWPDSASTLLIFWGFTANLL